MAFWYDFENAPEQVRANKARVADNLIRLRARLDEEVPPKTVFESLLVATWNIKWLGHYDRLDESLWYIAEILSRFDVVAIQEVRADLTDFKRIVELLGPWWHYILSDVTEGDSGNDERLAFLYDSRKVRFGGLAGELVLPPIEGENGDDTPNWQFDRTPFVTGFKCSWFEFMVATVHLHWGPGDRENPRRVQEADALGRFLKERLESGKTWAPHLILLGDFNIFDTDSAVYRALIDHGFSFPHEDRGLPDTGAGVEDRFYDHIGYLFAPEAHIATPEAGVLKIYDTVYRDDQQETYEGERGIATRADPRRYYRTTFRRNEMSDHLPLWVQLRIEFPDRYLERVARS
ncbi:MAG: endonuclease/exonuclease/phosphatase family protein [Alphaproteobacteria bacterium]|nr:endonuclease/exonuclease/phosphatase family protein [Alphaproteobacteria bacterium]